MYVTYNWNPLTLPLCLSSSSLQQYEICCFLCLALLQELKKTETVHSLSHFKQLGDNTFVNNLLA